MKEGPTELLSTNSTTHGLIADGKLFITGHHRHHQMASDGPKTSDVHTEKRTRRDSERRGT